MVGIISLMEMVWRLQMFVVTNFMLLWKLCSVSKILETVIKIVNFSALCVRLAVNFEVCVIYIEPRIIKPT